MPTLNNKQCWNPSCPNMKPCPVHGERKDHDRIRPDYYRWYYQKSWLVMRIRQLKRIPYCESCEEKGRYSIATEVDHIIPHRGDSALFFDSDNLQSLCESCHSAKTYTETLQEAR